MPPIRSAFAVESIFGDYQNLQEELASSPSGLAAINRSYNKQLLIASASSLEDHVKQVVPEMFERLGNNRLRVFVEKRVFARGYHTLFDWPSLSAKGFFSSFGENASKAFKSTIGSDADFKSYHDAFMELGNLRNELVHNDFASQVVPLTPLEIIEKYRLAVLFVDRFEGLIQAEPAERIPTPARNNAQS